MSAFLGPDQTATESLLATDPEVFPWVQKYQRSRETVSETDYEVSTHDLSFPLQELVKWTQFSCNSIILIDRLMSSTILWDSSIHSNKDLPAP